MLRRAGLSWEQQNIRPNWISKEVFEELFVYWNLDDFKVKYEKAKKFRAYEIGGCLNSVGSISIGKHVQWMVIITNFLGYILIYHIFLIKINYIN